LRNEVKEKLGGEIMKWDPDKYTFTNMPEADQFLHREYRQGWAL